MAKLARALLGTRASTYGTGFGIPGTCGKYPGTGEKIFTGTGTPKIRAGAAKVRATPARRYPVPFFKYPGTRDEYPPKRKRALALFLRCPWGRESDLVGGAVVVETNFTLGVCDFVVLNAFVIQGIRKSHN